MATPELNEAQERYKDSLVVIGVSIDSPQSWKYAVKKHDIKYTNLSDGMGQFAGFSTSFEFRGIPFYVMINPQGVITNTRGAVTAKT